MTPAEPEFTLGIEEEYFLVDRATRDVVEDPPAAMLADCEALLAGQVSPEFLRSQIEIGTRVLREPGEAARADLRRICAAPSPEWGRGASRHGADRRGDPPLCVGDRPPVVLMRLSFAASGR